MCIFPPHQLLLFHRGIYCNTYVNSTRYPYTQHGYTANYVSVRRQFIIFRESTKIVIYYCDILLKRSIAKY